MVCINPILSYLTIACTVIMYYYRYTEIIPTGKSTLAILEFTARVTL